MLKKKIVWKKQSPENSLIQMNFLKRKIGPEGFSIPVEGRIASTLAPIPISFPIVENATSPKEEALYLLKVAAEVEHALMIQYLYAAYSIKDEGSELRKTLIYVAIQEMGHFLAVQNLLLCIGGVEQVHFHKDEYRATSQDNPLPFTLEPLSKDLLAKFVGIEAPLDVPAQFESEVEVIRQIAKTKAGVELNPVGGLYMKIFWLFQKDDSPITDLMPLFPSEDLHANWHLRDDDFLTASEIEKYDVEYETWDTSSALTSHEIKLVSVRKRDDALNLIHLISAQGEGADFEDGQDSHFEQFLTAYRNYHGSEVIQVPTNPITRKNDEYKFFVEVKNDYSLLWCALLNHVYTSLLLDIYSSIFYKQYGPDRAPRFIRLIFSAMRTIITGLSGVISKLPLEAGLFQYDSDPRCGTPFEINLDFRIINDKSKVDASNLVIIDKINDIIGSVKKHSTFQAHVEKDEFGNAESCLSKIETYCITKRNLVI